MADLTRISISLEENLLEAFDKLRGFRPDVPASLAN